jgi:CheY-like chemotaxis protein
MRYKILIVDDSKLARMAAIRAVAGCSAALSPLEAGSAQDARAAMERDAPDIALVDFNMPGQDGLSLVAELRGLKPGMPIAVVSANHQQEIVNRTRELRAAFLAKPITEKSLGEFLAVALQDLKTASP